MMKWIALSLFFLANAAQAGPAVVDRVKSYRDGDVFAAELAIKGEWAETNVDVNFINETVQVDLPNLKFPKGKHLIRLDDANVKSVYIYSPNSNVVRMRVILNKGIQSRSFENALQVNRHGGSLSVMLAGKVEASAAQEKLGDLTRTYSINDLPEAGAVAAVVRTAEPSSDPALDEELAAAGKLVAKAQPKAAAPDAESEAVPAAVEAATAEGAVADVAEAKDTRLPSPVDTKNMKESEIPVLAVEKKDVKSQGNNLQKIVISLVVLAGVLGATVFGLKKWAKGSTAKNANTRIKVLTQHHLGPKKSLVIVQVAGESILVGVTDQSITMLKTLALIDDEVPEGVPNNFDNAMDEYEAVEYREPRRLNGRRGDDEDSFAMRGLNDIRDNVSKRLKGMREF